MSKLVISSKICRLLYKGKIDLIEAFIMALIQDEDGGDGCLEMDSFFMERLRISSRTLHHRLYLGTAKK